VKEAKIFQRRQSPKVDETFLGREDDFLAEEEKGVDYKGEPTEGT